MTACDAHQNEYLAAIAGMPDHTISPDLTLRLGRQVRVPRVYGDGVQDGTIAAREQDKHLGTMWLVDTPQGRLKYLPCEIEVR